MLPKSLRRRVDAFLAKRGHYLAPHTARYNHQLRRAILFKTYQIQTVLDVGGSDGGYGQDLRNIGYTGQILSFEPRAAAFKELEANAKNDPAWRVFNFALGSSKGESRINITTNGLSSSLLDLGAGASMGIRNISTETIRVERLDDVFQSLAAKPGILLKMDVQGFEHEVLAGAATSLQFIGTIQTELALMPSYTGQLRLHEMCATLAGLGYTPVSIEPGFGNEITGEQYEADGIFRKL